MIRPMSDPVQEVLWRDLKPVLDEEVQRLPEKYRAPVVLCYLEGRPYSQAALELGCSKASISLRLAEARERLRERLNRRGVLLSVALFPTVLAPGRVKAVVPEKLEESTTQAVLRWSIGDMTLAQTLTASVVACARPGLIALIRSKLKLGLAVALAIGVLAAGAGIILHQTLTDRPPSARDDPDNPKKGRKTLADRLDGLPPKGKGTP